MNYWKLGIRFITIVFLMSQEEIRGQTPFIIQNPYAQVQLDKYLHVLEDSSAEIGVEEILADTSGRTFYFTPFTDHPDPLVRGSIYWGKITLHSEIDIENWVLEFNKWAYAGAGWERGNGRVDLYQVEGSNIIAHQISGSDVPQQAKTYQTDVNKNAFLFSLRAGQSKQYLIRIKQNVFSFYPNFNLSIHPPDFEMAYPSFFGKLNEKGYGYYLSVLIGIVVMALFYHLLLFVYIKEPSYGWYSLWLVFPLITLAQSHPVGFLSTYFFPNYPQLRPIIWILGTNLIWVAFWQFGRAFIHSKHKYARLDFWIKILMGILVLNLIFKLFRPDEHPLGGIELAVLGLSNLVGLGISIFFLLQADKTTRYFGAGSIVANLGVIVGALWTNHLIKLSFDPFISAILIQIFVYSFGLAYKRQLEAKAKTDAELKLLQNEREKVERLARIDKLKDQFLANTSHELRTPLNGIIGLSESLLAKTEDMDKREDLSLIISSGTRLSNLVNDILDFSKLKSKEIELRRRATDLHSHVDLVIRSYMPLIKGKELELRSKISQDLPLISTDENRLQQILFNLIGNAVKFTEKGYVCVSATAKENFIEVKVSDTGIGIPANKLELIFQEFEQADGGISREFAGTGLGLSISKKLVELHGGEMWVESTLNEGSTFYFTLPITMDTASISDFSDRKPDLISQPVISSMELQKSAKDKEIKILIVDDEPINQKVLANHLSANYSISAAMNGADALRMIEEQEKFDLVLLDVMMPRMNGYEVCQKIREKFLPSELPVIMVTAKDQVQDLVEGLGMGANDYVNKPFSKDEFLARVRTHLDLYRINQVTHRFVPNDFIRSLGKSSLTDLNLGDQVEKEVSVFFSDIRSYTSISEKMSPKETFTFVNGYAGQMGPIIRTHQGFVHQYLGDGIMAIFQHKPDHALHAAIAMQKELIASESGIRVGMGIHTGKLIMGIIGDQERMDAATISDTVNTAARMEGLTKIFGATILLSEASVASLSNPDQFELRYLGKVQVKGKKEALGIYECLDGLPEMLKKLYVKQKQLFEKALSLYFDRDFLASAGAFKKVLAENPDDLPSKRFLAKAARYIVEGVDETWTGIEAMEKN